MTATPDKRILDIPNACHIIRKDLVKLIHRELGITKILKQNLKSWSICRIFRKRLAPEFSLNSDKFCNYFSDFMVLEDMKI